MQITWHKYSKELTIQHTQHTAAT